jgi:endonuclease/exonuclease/phosphatase family metal-dependent hydrolase
MRKAAVAATIRSRAPDVIGLQEASPSRLHGRSVSQYQDLLNELGSPYKVTLTGGAGVDNRILYNVEKVNLLRTGVVALPKGGGRRFVVWAIFQQIGTGKKFLFANTHLSPGKSSSALRVRQTQKMISALKSIATADMPTITVGDFNMFKWMGGNGYQPYNMMVSSGYLDPLGNTYRSHSASSSAFVENRIHTNFSTFNDFKRTAPAFSYDNGTQLDFIFVTKMRVSEWETVVNVDSNRRFVGTIPSDHNMVRATVWLP